MVGGDEVFGQAGLCLGVAGGRCRCHLWRMIGETTPSELLLAGFTATVPPQPLLPVDLVTLILSSACSAF